MAIFSAAGIALMVFAGSIAALLGVYGIEQATRRSDIGH